jgi:uncharacterized protein
VTRVGVISDTHGLVRPEALEFLQGSDSIIHCGDICEAGVIETLSRIAPVTAVRGNNDKGSWAKGLAHSEWLQIEHSYVYVIHDLAEIDIDPAATAVSVVLSGHSHKPLIEHRGNVIFMNPGSAGPRRFTLPISIGELIIKGATVRPRIVTLA